MWRAIAIGISGSLEGLLRGWLGVVEKLAAMILAPLAAVAESNCYLLSAICYLLSAI
ncbi:MAG: hypothetical protein ACI9W6_000478 [Motiliproteus sp.]|jgi:hypothetical protein